LEGFQEIELAATMNLSASWKGLKKGGTCKQKRFFVTAAPWSLIRPTIPMKRSVLDFALKEQMTVGCAITMTLQVSSNFSK
jgi:hypothetical protein